MPTGASCPLCGRFSPRSFGNVIIWLLEQCYYSTNYCSSMVRTYRKRTKRGSYGSDRLALALRAVREGVPVKRAGLQFGIPPRTLRRHRYGKVRIPGSVKLGRLRTALPEEFEVELRNYVKFMEKSMYGLTTQDVRRLAFELAAL